MGLETEMSDLYIKMSKNLDGLLFSSILHQRVVVLWIHVHR